ncbi:hypothetical protein BKI52_09810 [marine bacterium AO1-C]|nr:hypothetical protein BKI52_09810 [marine bacterium AO1-C]
MVIRFHTIKSKLLFYFAIFLVITFTIIATNFWFDQKKEKIEQIALQLQSINLNTQIINRLESEFFKDEIINPQFYITGNSKYLKQRDSLLIQVRKALKSLENNQETASFNINNKIDSIVSHYNEYESIFAQLVNLIKHRGFKDYGLEGYMRDAIHRVEDSGKVHLPNRHKLTVLMIRRHEKDFILRKQPFYIDYLNKEVNKLRSYVKTSVWPTRVQYRLDGDLELYQELFIALAEVEATIGYNNGQGIRQDLKILAENIKVKLDRFNQVIMVSSQALESQITITLFLIMTACLVLIVILGYTITRMLSRPIRRLSNSIGEVIQSNFSRNNKLLQLDTKDEIGMLSKDFAYMLETVHSTMDEIRQKSAKIEEKQTLLMDSLRYAKQIQQAILPEAYEFEGVFQDYFIIFKAQQVVSGDFYWLHQRGNKTFIAVVDCTGHGVPGAFMSMIGNTLLHEIVNEKNLEEPALILEVLHLEIRIALRQEQKKNDDGMDIGLCLIEDIPEKSNDRQVTFAGARRPLLYSMAQTQSYYSANQPNISIHSLSYQSHQMQSSSSKNKAPIEEVVEGKLFTIKGTKRSIGGLHRYEDRPFTNQVIQLPKGTILYLTSDGYTDQHNIKREKLGRHRLNELIGAVSHLTLPQQKTALINELDRHMKNEVPQRDDITILGVQI